MWHLLEPLHAVLYYAPEAFEEAAALGYKTDERWPSYFAWRAAPLGAAGAERVTSAFYSFSPRMVEQYIPAAWDIASPGDVLAARTAGRRPHVPEGVRGPGGQHPRLAEAAALLVARPRPRTRPGGRWPPRNADARLARRAASGALAGRDDPARAPRRRSSRRAADRGARPGRVAGLLRGHRRGLRGEVREPRLERQEWGAARERLVARGLLDADGTATEAGRELRAEVERRTDELAAAPWAALGAEDRDRLAELLGTLWVEVLGAGVLPAETTLGIGKV